MRARRLLRPALIAALGGLLLTGPAQAHAGYLRSEPGDGAIVATSPPRVEIWFLQEMFRREGENGIRVKGPDGALVSAGQAAIDDDDRTHMTVGLEPDLSPGVYEVEWWTLSAEDGDNDSGVFTFTLDPDAALTSTPMQPSTATPEPTALPVTPLQATAPEPTPAGSGSNGGCLGGLLPAFFLALLGVVGGGRRSERR